MVRGSVRNEKTPLITKEDIIGDNIPLSDQLKPYGNGLDSNKDRGASVIWKNLKVTAHIKKQHMLRTTTHSYKEIIHNVNGYIQPSTLVAIMGASGSGKSTLMSVLANRQPADVKVEGDLRVNGRKVQIRYMRQISGYVYQDDLFIPTLTVLEHLHFAAQMKLDRRISAEYRRQLVNELLMDVGLTKCAHSFIGSSSYGKGKINLSGGEQKRLSVATELLTDPPLLFCDEPTTGLDSYSAFKLVNVMKNMTSQKGKTIICSIHQPSDKIFGLFQQIILLHNGKIAFNGTSEDALTFFKSMGYEYNEEQNPAEYLVRSLAIIPGNEIETAKQASDVCTKFENSNYAKEMYENIEKEILKPTRNVVVSTKVERPSWFFMLYLLTYRNVLGIIRDPSIQGMRIINKVILAILLGLCMMGTVTMTQEGIQSMKGALFTMVAENFFPPMYGVMDHVPKQMPVFLREYTNNINSPLLFYLSNVISLVPGYLLDPLFFSLLLYVLIGLRDSMFAFLWTLVVNILVINTSAAFGMLLSISAGGVQMAQVVATPIDAFYMVLSGIFINLRTVPVIFRWIRYVSWMAYSTEALMILQLDDVDYIACSSEPGVPCLHNGTEVLASLDFSADNLWRNLSSVFAIYLIIHAASYVVLAVKLHFRMKR